MEFIHPIRGIGGEELADWPAIAIIKVDRPSPFVLVAVGKIVLGEMMQIIAVGTEVVVDDIQNDGDAQIVRAIDKGTQVIRMPIKAGGSEEIHAVVTPAKA